MSHDIRFWTSTADELYPSTLTVSAAQGAVLVIAANAGKPFLIGRFSFPPPADEVDALVRAVAAPEFFAHQNTPLPVPGEAHRKITVLLDGRNEFSRIATWSNRGKAFAAAEKLLLGIWDETVQHPEHALGMSMSIAPEAASEGTSEASVTLSLVNPGPVPIAIPGPDDWKSKRIRLVFTAFRTDVPPDEFISMMHQKFVELGAEALTHKPPGAGSAPVVIQPGASAVFQFRASLPLARGSYEASGSFATLLLDEQGAEVLQGICTSARQTLTRD